MSSTASAHARRAFDWIDSVAVEVDGGRSWSDAGEPCDDLYSGTAGVLLGCAEGMAGGLETTAIAAGAVARLAHLTADAEPVATLSDDSLFSGWAGVAVALRAWSDVAGDAQAGKTAALVTSQIAERVLHAPPAGSGPADVPDALSPAIAPTGSSREVVPDSTAYTDLISGRAGVLLALVAAGSGDAGLAAAGVVADHLVAMAEPGPVGPQWRMVADYQYLMPGFSHGTAGVAYALAAAGRRLDRPDLIAVATRGADTLLALGRHPDGWALPLVIPPQPHRPDVTFGWCHGPTGTVRLFLLLDEINPQPRWRDAIDACLHALSTSGLPARRHPGFWDNVARCCGTAGVGSLLVDRYQATGDPYLLEWADELATDVIGRAVHQPAGITWSNVEHTATPPELPPEPGFMQGAAGIAGWLARLDAVRADRDIPNAPLGVVPAWL